MAEILTDLPEQQEVIGILERIDRETGWRLAGIVQGLKKIWGWEKMEQKSLAAQFLPRVNSGHELTMTLAKRQQIETIQATQTTTPPQQQSMPTVSASQQVAAPRPVHVNPLNFADFSLPNHPYQNWYEPPNRSNTYNSQGLL